jgi:hypothetical protein
MVVPHPSRLSCYHHSALTCSAATSRILAPTTWLAAPWRRAGWGAHGIVSPCRRNPPNSPNYRDLPTKGATFERLEEQIIWYERKSVQSQHWFKGLKTGQLLMAGAIPVLAVFRISASVGGSLGALVVIVEGFQQLNHYHQNWLNYRSTCEALKHEKYLYLANAAYGHRGGDRRRDQPGSPTDVAHRHP